jgi:DNA polymerase-1
MKIITFTNEKKESYRLAILIKEEYVDKFPIRDYYVTPLLLEQGIKTSDIICIGLRYFNNSTPKTKCIEWFKNNMLPYLKAYNIKAIGVADSKYFEFITGNKSSEFIKSYCKSNFDTYINVIPFISYKAINYNVHMALRLTESLKSTRAALADLPPSCNARVVKNQYYPSTTEEIESSLDNLLNYELLAVDLETFSLDHRYAGIGTIAFSSDEDSCIAFKVQYQSQGERTVNPVVYGLLRKFFDNYEGKLLFHRGSYDIKILIFELFMEYDEDYKGMVYGLSKFESIEDTMLMTYVCTNNTVQNVLNLKDNTLEFAGNYAIDMNDITKHEPKSVLTYNGRDTCNTVYLYNKYKDKLIVEKQTTAYQILKDFILVGVQLEIRGFPIDIEYSKALYEDVKREIEYIEKSILNSKLLQKYLVHRHLQEIWEYNLSVTKKVANTSTYPKPTFNVNSDTQLADFIHNYLGVEVVEFTKTGSPSMTINTLTELKHKLEKEYDDRRAKGVNRDSK